LKELEWTINVKHKDNGSMSFSKPEETMGYLFMR
jgi:hypothetical protein